MTTDVLTSKITDVVPIPPTSTLVPPKLTFNAYETAKMLGIGHVQVRQLVRAGDLPTLPGRNINIPLVAIERYLENLSGGLS
jgi:Helix-turn-helix domain